MRAECCGAWTESHGDEFCPDCPFLEFVVPEGEAERQAMADCMESPDL